MKRSFKVGDIVRVTDRIDWSLYEFGTVRLVEQDPELGVDWLYIRANDEQYNIQVDPRIGTYWCIIENTSEYLIAKEDIPDY